MRELLWNIIGIGILAIMATVVVVTAWVLIGGFINDIRGREGGNRWDR